jgi:hypothetical protein
MNKQTWYFTFGSGQEYPDRYVKFTGGFNEARKKMFRRFGNRWAFQYSEEAFDGQAERWGLTELEVTE